MHNAVDNLCRHAVQAVGNLGIGLCVSRCVATSLALTCSFGLNSLCARNSYSIFVMQVKSTAFHLERQVGSIDIATVVLIGNLVGQHRSFR